MIVWHLVVALFVYLFRMREKIYLHAISNEEASKQTNIPALPMLSDSNNSTRQFALGETLKLDDLGPIIINPGTLENF
jgi:hypothetical protein